MTAVAPSVAPPEPAPAPDRQARPTLRRRWDSAEAWVRTTLLTGGVAIAVFGLVAAAVSLTTPGSHAASWFPAAGISVGAIAVAHGRRRYAFLVAIGVASVLAYSVGGRPLSIAICFALANMIEAGVAGHWLSRADRLRLATSRDLGRFLMITAVAASIGGAVASLSVWQFIGDQAGQTWVIVTLAHATGALVLLPFVMRVPPHATSQRPWELAGQWLAVLTVTAAIFIPTESLPLGFGVVVVLVWTGLRLRARAAALQLLVVSGLATLLTTHGRGPFAHLSTTETHQVLQGFLLACTVMVLALTVAATQRKVALARVSANERFLDELVETMDVGVLAVDAAGKALMLNRSLRELHGTHDLPEGTHDPRVPERFGLFHADGVTPLTPAEVPMTRVMTTGQVHDVELTIVPTDQPPRNVVVHGRRIHAEDGEVLGGVIAVHDVTAIKQHEVELQAAVTALADEREFEAAVLEVINAGVVACDADGNVVVRNATQRRITGIAGVALALSDVGAVPLRVRTPEGVDIPPAQAPLYRALAGEDITDMPVRMAPDGLPEHDVIVTARPIRGTDGRLLGAVSAFTDVTSQLAVQAELRESVAFHDALLAASPDLIFIVDGQTGAGVWYSRNLEQMLGYSEDEIREIGAESVTRLVHPDDAARLQAGRVAARDLVDGDVQQTRYRIRAQDGSYRWLSRRITPFSRNEDGTILQLLGVARDVTDSVDVENRLTDAALHDPLTGLPNRRLLADRLGLALRRTARSGEELAVLFCDLDGFKNVNDSAGHSAGDRVLITTADRLRALLRPQDTVARVGGDEFVIILDPSPAASPAPGEARDGPAAAPIGPRAAAALVGRRITHALSQPIEVDDSVHVVTVSIGVTFAQSGDQPDEVLSDADSAMYKAKSQGKDRVEIYDTGLRADAAERGRVERVLRQALADKAPPANGASAPAGPGRPTSAGKLGISVAYQPILDLRTQRLIGVEALARLHDAQGLPIGPDVFIPIAEETALIASLGHYVLTTACNDLARWHADHPRWRHLGVSVNLSARQTGRADLVASVQEALAQAGVAPTLLTLELTESVLLEAGRSTLTALREIRALGVKIDIDDFGTGYASLRYLAELPVTGLKIDRSFTAGLPSDPTSQTIVRAIAGLARDLDLTCVAEGIETDAQLLALPSGLAGQGYLLGRPAPAAEINARLTAEESRTGAAYRPAGSA
jgi:PAS domain S-box-containing protein